LRQHLLGHVDTAQVVLAHQRQEHHVKVFAGRLAQRRQLLRRGHSGHQPVHHRAGRVGHPGHRRL